jgi:uncharacterized protein
MTQSPENGQEQIFDATPYLKLRIDKEGRWFQNGAEITHPEIYRTFNQMLVKTSDGGYQVKMGREVCAVEVEDAPFVVKTVTQDDDSRIFIELNDGSQEIFDPRNLWIGDRNVPYSRVKNGSFHARFSRPAYYQLTKHIVSDADGKEFFFLLGEERIPIRRASSIET